MQLDLQCTKFIYATNSAFTRVEHPKFIKFCQMLRPGYDPPHRKEIGGPLLDTVYNSIENESADELKDITVCMAIDGWSNIHNEPVICVCVTDPSGTVHLIDSVDTGVERHTSNYLEIIATAAIKKCNQKYGCKVRSLVSDNASNMKKMRETLAMTENLDIVTYGCSAHILNLLAQDINIKEVNEQVKHIIVYFQNHHFPKAKYKDAGGKGLILPQDVHWNSLADCLESYIQNWPILMKVCDENRLVIHKDIVAKVQNLEIKHDAEDLLTRLKIIAVALDKMQRNDCTISEGIELWFGVQNDLQQLGITGVTQAAKVRFDMAITEYHFLANLLDPRYRVQSLQTVSRMLQ
ncbi:uncharacterized protein [Centruroides vittatus]|uniref:uncharacterized protein n=1 Tax=Centruroides vittatus TaxID=120091 RepID=UPI00350EB810